MRAFRAALKLSKICSSVKFTLPMESWTMPAFSARYSTRVACLISLTAVPTLLVTVPFLLLGVLGPSRRPIFPIWGGHLFGGEKDVEVSETALDLCDKVVGPYRVGSGLFGLSGEVSLGEDGDVALLARAVGQVGDPADVLVALSSVDAEPDRHVDALGELGGGGLFDQPDGVFDGIQLVFVDLRGDGLKSGGMGPFSDVCSQIVTSWCERLIG